jgi:hypothetical protein
MQHLVGAMCEVVGEDARFALPAGGARHAHVGRVEGEEHLHVQGKPEHQDGAGLLDRANQYA